MSGRPAGDDDVAQRAGVVATGRSDAHHLAVGCPGRTGDVDPAARPRDAPRRPSGGPVPRSARRAEPRTGLRAPPAPGYGAPAAPGYGAPAVPAYGYASAPMVPVVTPVAPLAYGVAPVAVMGPPKSKAVAAVLCFFLGGFGAHRFYTGQTGIAVAQLLLTVLLFWTIIVPLGVLVWVVVDFILILTGGVTDKFGRPLV